MQFCGAVKSGVGLSLTSLCLLGTTAITVASSDWQAPANRVAGVDNLAPQTNERMKPLKELLQSAGIKVEELNPPATSQQAQDIHVEWLSQTQPAAVTTQQKLAPGAFALVKRKAGLGSLPRQRAPELSPQQLLIIATDDQQRLRWWGLIADPRILRAEFPQPSGELAGQIFYHAQVQFVVAVPDDATITELRFYHPRWTGAAYELDLLGTTSVK